MSEREYIKYNTSIQVASNSGGLQKDDEGNLAAIVELRLPDNIFPAENGKKKVDSVQMLTTKMRISMENTPIAQFDVDEDTTTKLDKLHKGSNAAFITTSQMDLYPYVIKGDNQILPVKSNSAFPHYKTQISRIDISIWMGEDYITLDTLYVHPLSPGTFAENIGRYQEPFQKGGVFAALNHLSNLVVKQYMPVKKENETVSIFNVGSIEQMLQDGIESAFVYNNTGFNEPLQYSIFLISEDAYNNNHFPPVEDDDFTKEDVDPENTMIIEELGGKKAFFVNKIFGPDYTVHENEISNLRYSVKPKVSFTEQKLRISYDTSPFVNNIPILWCNSYVNTYDNPLQLTMGELYNEYTDGFKPPKRVYSYGVTKNDDDSYFFTLRSSTTNPVNIVGNKDLRDTFSCLPWITVDTKTNKFFTSRAKAKYRINQKKQTKTTLTNEDVVRAVYHPSTATYPPYELRRYVFDGIDGRGIDSSLTEHCFHYSFIINIADINTNETVFNKRFPKVKRMRQNIQYGTEQYLGTILVAFGEIQRKSNENTQTNYDEMKTYNTLEYNYEATFPSSDVRETYVSPVEEIEKSPLNTYTATVGGVDQERTLQHGALGASTNGGVTEYYLLEPPQGNWSYNGDLHRAWLPISEPDFIAPLIEGSGGQVSVDVYWNIPQTQPENWHITLMTSTTLQWWDITYDNVDTKQETYYKQETVETIADNETLDDLLFNFLPNVDLDNDGNFYVLDGTTTNLSMGQQEVIEGSVNYLYDITTITTITEYSQTVNENWNGTKEGSPYISEKEYRYKLSRVNGVIIPASIIYGYNLIDQELPDTPENRTNQRITLISADLNQTLNTNTRTISNAALRNSRTEDHVPRSSTTTDHITSSSTTYPIGTTNLPDQYTNWMVTSQTQTGLSITNRVVAIDTMASNVFYLPNSSDEYWSNSTEYISADPLYRCVPVRECDGYSTFGSVCEQHWFFNSNYYDGGFSIFYREEKRSSYTMQQKRNKNSTSVTVEDNSAQIWYGNIRVNFEWDNIPIVVISPIQSIVLTLQGMNVSQEFQPINVAQAGGSSLTSTIPVIENYYSLAQTLRDLHDELVVIKDSYDDQPCYSLSTVDGQARSLRLAAYYITKDGRLHQIYIPPNGVFSLQVTFGISYYFTS